MNGKVVATLVIGGFTTYLLYKANKALSFIAGVITVFLAYNFWQRG